MRLRPTDAVVAIRLFCAGTLLVAGAVGVAYATHPERVASRPLGALPLQMDGWEGRDSARFPAAVEQVLGVDEYVNRVYAKEDGVPVSLYVGFYGSQRQGDTIHSPMNCLPGAGWRPLSHTRIAIAVTDASWTPGRIVVNQYVIEKGADRQLVLYWYQSRGRAIASEYVSRMFMVYDAMRSNRTDAALVRVITPLRTGDADDLDEARARATAFVSAMFPRLKSVLPA